MTLTAPVMVDWLIEAISAKTDVFTSFTETATPIETAVAVCPSAAAIDTALTFEVIIALSRATTETLAAVKLLRPEICASAPPRMLFLAALPPPAKAKPVLPPASASTVTATLAMMLSLAIAKTSTAPPATRLPFSIAAVVPPRPATRSTRCHNRVSL